MFQHELRAARMIAQRLHDSRPVALALADNGLAQFHFHVAIHGKFLDVNRGDALTIFLDPLYWILLGVNGPTDIELPIYQWPALKNAVDGHGAIWQFLEFEIMIVPAKAVTFFAQGFGYCTTALAEAFPIGGCGFAFFGHDEGAIEIFNPHGFADFENKTGDEAFDGSLNEALKIGLEQRLFLTF